MRLDEHDLYEDTPALLIALDFVMPPAGKGPLSDGPLHPRAPGGLRHPWTPGVSCAASLRRQLPSAKAPSGDLPPVTPIRAWLPQAWLSEGALPTPPLRRMCRRQSATSLASTHETWSVGSACSFAGWLLIFIKRDALRLRVRNLSAAIRVRSRRSPPRPCEAEAPALRMRAAMNARIRALKHSEGDESSAHIRIPPGRSPEARQRRREAARRKNAVHDDTGFQGAEPFGTRGCRGCSLQHPCPPEA